MFKKRKQRYYRTVAKTGVSRIAQVYGEIETRCVPLFSVQRSDPKHFTPSKILSNMSIYEFRYTQERAYTVRYYRRTIITPSGDMLTEFI